MTHLKVF